MVLLKSNFNLTFTNFFIIRYSTACFYYIRVSPGNFLLIPQSLINRFDSLNCLVSFSTWGVNLAEQLILYFYNL